MGAMALTYEWQPGELHRLTACKTDLDTRSKEFLSGSYVPLTKGDEDLTIDVSSAIGLFERKSEVGARESARLERCLADLLMLLVQPELSKKGNTILIEGPQFPKIIGRIGYRYPRTDITIAFVTADESPSKTARASGTYKARPWDGPYPGYEEEHLTRSYFSTSDSTRVDLFSQGLGHFSLYHEAEGCPIGAEAKLSASSNYIRKFSTMLLARKRHHQRELLPLDQPRIKSSVMRDNLNESNANSDDTTHRSIAAKAGGEVPTGINEAIFEGLSSAKLNTEAGRQRFSVLLAYFEADGLGSFVEQFRFLEYVEQKLRETKAKRSFVFTIHDLRTWRSEGLRLGLI